MIKVLLLVAIAMIVAVSCATKFAHGSQKAQREPLPAFTNVGVEGFQTLIADAAVQLLDVRTAEEFAEGHIAGAVLVDVNEDGFVERAMAVIDPSRPVAVYCRSGRRSARAAILLATEGLKVTNLDGGVIAWQDARKDLIK